MINNILLLLFLTNCTHVLIYDTTWFPLSGNLWSLCQQALQGYLLFGIEAANTELWIFIVEHAHLWESPLSTQRMYLPKEYLKLGFPEVIFLYPDFPWSCIQNDQSTLILSIYSILSLKSISKISHFSTFLQTFPNQRSPWLEQEVVI